MPTAIETSIATLNQNPGWEQDEKVRPSGSPDELEGAASASASEEEEIFDDHDV
jgi:hypothetical protein